MKLREIFRYEVVYRFRSPSTWAYAGFLILVSIWMFLATAVTRLTRLRLTRAT